MDVYTCKPSKLFAGPIRYSVPPYQRGYVWDESQQWEPLWSDVTALAESELEAPHFMGALVLMQSPSQVGDLDTRTVVDGQQRLTTLQVLLDAVRREMESRGLRKEAGKVKLLVQNPAESLDEPEHVFKLWPTLDDQAAFREIMGSTEADAQSGHRLSAAHRYFRKEAGKWLEADPERMAARAQALEKHLKGSLEFAVVDLSQNDNQFAIFETLNARGTPLLQTDLAKNFFVDQIRQKTGRTPTGEEVQALWPLQGAWWKAHVRQGRSYEPRSEGFLYYWLIAVTRQEIKAGTIFDTFRRVLRTEFGGDPDRLAERIRRDAAHYRQLMDEESNPARCDSVLYRYRCLGTGALMPLLLSLTMEEISDKDGAGGVIETLVMRRALARYASNGLNHLGRTLLQASHGRRGSAAREALIACMAEQTAASRRWPSVEEIRDGVRTRPVYSRADTSFARMVLEAFELHLRSSYAERFKGGNELTIEHVLPQAWTEHWPLAPEDTERADRRNALMHTLGNLTLTTDKLNTAMSNQAWDEKRTRLGGHSTLALNSELLREAGQVWNVEAIEARAGRMGQWAEALWPVPLGQIAG